MQLVVEAASVADGFPVGVPSPERRGRRLAVGARRALASRRRLEAEDAGLSSRESRSGYF